MNKYRKILLVLLVLSAAGVAQAQNQDFRFHWAPSLLVDGDGITRPEAVEYQVFVSRDGGLAEMIATVVGDTTFILSAVPDISHRMRVVGVDAVGNVSPASKWSDPIMFESTRGSELPGAAALTQNYPNPFNPETRLVYGIPQGVAVSDRVQLDIFSVDGRLVRTMEIDRAPGWHEVVWDGTDDRGLVASSGMYVTRLVVGAMVETKKMTMLK